MLTASGCLPSPPSLLSLSLFRRGAGRARGRCSSCTVSGWLAVWLGVGAGGGQYAVCTLQACKADFFVVVWVSLRLRRARLRQMRCLMCALNVLLALMIGPVHCPICRR
jgi:hypothetical protein